MNTEHPGEVREYLGKFSDLAGLLGHNSITPGRHHRFQAEAFTTRSLLFAILSWPTLELIFRNYEADSDTRRWHVLGKVLHPSCACGIEVYRTIFPETIVEQDCILNGREY
jgi:hypothetical protein